jgi:uncharacterized protein with HEPN domain
MRATLADRLVHIRQAITHIHDLTDAWSDTEIVSDPIKRAALERFVEIISEASRYIPDETRGRHADIPWIKIRNIGNVLRHGYDAVTFETLLLIARAEIYDLERAIDLIIAEDENGEA